MLATTGTKIQERRLIVAEQDTAVKIFKQVLTKLIDTKWRTTEQADGILI